MHLLRMYAIDQQPLPLCSSAAPQCLGLRSLFGAAGSTWAPQMSLALICSSILWPPSPESKPSLRTCVAFIDDQILGSALCGMESCYALLLQCGFVVGPRSRVGLTCGFVSRNLGIRTLYMGGNNEDWEIPRREDQRVWPYTLERCNTRSTSVGAWCFAVGLQEILGQIHSIDM